ncbi:unnamed protein product, partial [Brassica rapa subsp. trilocularis]
VEGAISKVVTSPYALSTKDDPENVITKVVFTGRNYDEWERKIRTEGSDEEEDWMTVNAMVTSWIFNTIDPKIRSSITHREIARDLWDGIKARFRVKSEVKVQQLKEELMNCKQRDVSLEAYYGKLQVIWEDLSNYEFKPVCSCGGCKCQGCTCDFMRFSDRDREKEARGEAMAFAVNTGVTQSRGESRSNNSGGGFCTHCNKSGHDIAACYQLHGYPDWWVEKYGKGRGAKSSQQGNKASYGRGASVNAVSRITPTVDAHAVTGLSREQWDKLVKMLGEKTEETRLTVDIHSVAPCLVGLPNGKLVMADQEGSVHLTETLTLHSVLYVKELKCNLISVSQLIDELN